MNLELFNPDKDYCYNLLEINPYLKDMNAVIGGLPGTNFFRDGGLRTLSLLDLMIPIIWEMLDGYQVKDVHPGWISNEVNFWKEFSPLLLRIREELRKAHEDIM